MRSQTWSEGACGRSASITRAKRPRSANADVAGPRRQPMARRVGDADCSAPESSGCIIQVGQNSKELAIGNDLGSEDRCSSPPAQTTLYRMLRCTVDFRNGSWLCKNSTRYNRTRNFEPYDHAESKKTQKFVFRSALRPNQISFSHSQDQKRLWRSFDWHVRSTSDR
jgi:hypothetical protein